jgi:sugar lactone lactonase YvrE
MLGHSYLTRRTIGTSIVTLLIGIGVACQPPAGNPDDNGNGGSNNGGGGNGGTDNGNNGGTTVGIDQLAAIILNTDGSLIGADVVANSIVRIDRATGAATLISGNGAGSGPELESPNNVFRDADGSLLVTTLKRVIFRIDPSSGNRTLLLDAGDPNDLFPDSFNGIAATDDGSIYVTNSSSSSSSNQFIAQVDAQAGELITINAEDVTSGVGDILPLGGNNVLVVDLFRRAVIEVALPSGDVTIVSNVDRQAGPADTEVGTGPDFGQPPRALAIADDGTIYEGDEANSSFGLGVSVVFAIDPATGNRTVVSGPDNGDGPDIGRPDDLIVDADGLLVMIDFNYTELLIIDPQTGDRSLLGSN